MLKRVIYLVVTFFFVFSVSGFAKITVKSVRGKVSYKTGRVWKVLSKGMSLKEGTKISTGVRGRTVIKLNNHFLRIRPLTMIKLYENKSKNKSSLTRIGLRRGSVRAKINRKKNVRTVFKISTPVATSSVRGTEEEVSYGPNAGMQIEVIIGKIEALSENGIKKFVQGRSIYRCGTDGSKPDSLLGKLKSDAENPLTDPNLSDAEKDGLVIGGDDLPTSENPMDILPSNLGKTQVKVQVDWPD